MALVKWAVIVLAVGLPVVAILLCFYFYKYVRDRPLSQPVPFPPVQPLAHHRESAFPLTHSRASLLPVPSPHFYSPPLTPSSTSSLGSDDQASPRITPADSPGSSAPGTPSTAPSTARRHRPRPLSVSSHNTVRSKASRNTLRGTPHHPRSSIQIVLPAPLASQPNLADRERDERVAGVADRWARVPHVVQPAIHEHSDTHHEPARRQPRRTLSNPSLPSPQTDTTPPLPAKHPPSSFAPPPRE